MPTRSTYYTRQAIITRYEFDGTSPSLRKATAEETHNSPEIMPPALE